MSNPDMFDYDVRPVTPRTVLIGTIASAPAYAIRDFLKRNGRDYEWVDAEELGLAAGLLQAGDLERLPLCILPDGTRIAPATVEKVAIGLGMVREPALSEYDLLIAGAGPAGLAAAVYAASEGLTTLTIESIAPGGQAGTTSLIENYLGFPEGISGSEMAARAYSQARRFGAEILLARRLSGLEQDGPGYIASLSDGTAVRGRSMVVATGVEWRRLDVPGIEDLVGAGVYYGAGPSEAVSCQDAEVAVVGGGNSAGQAAVRFSKYAGKVTLLVRSADLSSSMSHYLVEHVSSIANIEVRTGTQVVGCEAGHRLDALLVRSSGGERTERLPVDALFVCIGGDPRTEEAARCGVATDRSGYLRTGADLAGEPSLDVDWELSRAPLPLETNMPGLFAAGDVRSGSTKRCAAAIGEGAMAVSLVHRRLAELGHE